MIKRSSNVAVLILVLVIGVLGVITLGTFFSRAVTKTCMDDCEATTHEDAIVLTKHTDVLDYVQRVKQACESGSSDDLARIEDEPSYQHLQEMLHDMRIPSARDFYVAVPSDAGNELFVVADGGIESASADVLTLGQRVVPSHYETVLSAATEGEGTNELLRTNQGLLGVCIASLNGRDGSSGYLIAIIQANRVILDAVSRDPWSFVALGVFAFGLPLLFMLTVKKLVVEPMACVASAIRDYSRDRVVGKTKTGYFADIRIRGNDELAELVDVLSQMETDVSTYEQNLVEVTAQQERAHAELEMAATIQLTSLPNKFPAFPNRHEFDIFASMDPAREVGGDFYDFFMLDDDHLCMVIADVSNKGVPAALFMMTSKSVLAGCIHQGGTPADALMNANNILCSNNQANMFVTVWLGVLQISTGKLVTSNAGHEYPALKPLDNDFELIHDNHGFVAGGMENMRYTNEQFVLLPGSKLFVYTDGLPEATNAEGEMLGLDRTAAILRDVQDGTPEQILRGVREAVDEFVGEAEQFDDLTMLCLEYKGTNL